ncbi:fimbrial adhesin FimH (plasmid) [Serratia marcescens]|nr:fimbrial adhesin FimH [Serratia marcescens]
MKLVRLIVFSFFPLTAVLTPLCVWAGSCVPNSGVEDGSLDISEYISNPSNDYDGFTIVVPITSKVAHLPVTCSCKGYNSSAAFWDWSAFNVPTEIIGDKTYGIVGDYLSFAVSPRKGFWTPFEDKEYKNSSNVCTDKVATSGGANNIAIRIRKSFVGSVNIPKTLLYTKGTNTRKDESFRDPEIQFYISGSVSVPQTCEFTPDKVISIDFGNIGASAFSQAGAGNKPAGVNPLHRTIGIQCKNVDAQAMLSLRLEAANVSGNAVVSDNPDLGFVVADGNHNPLTPNNIDSKIPFRLDDNASATIPVSAWPVSVTGNKPAEGKFTSEGYLRVDFD